MGPWESPIKSDGEKQDEKQTDDVPIIPTKEKAGEIEKLPVKEQILVLEEQIYQTGIASWYGSEFHGRRTANGEIYDKDKLTAAHKNLPFHTLVEVENIDNRKKVVVRINDRGPFVKGRVIDLSRKAAVRLGLHEPGTAPVHIRIIKPTSASPSPEEEIPEVKIETTRPVSTGTPRVEKEIIELTPLQPLPQNNSMGDDKVNQPGQTYSPAPIIPLSGTNTPLPNGQYYIQVGAFGSEKNADRQLKNVLDIFPGIKFKIIQENGLYKIISPPLNSKKAAENVRTRLDEKGYKSIIKEKQGTSD